MCVFVCMHVSVPCECLVPSRVRIGLWVPWAALINSCEYFCGLWESNPGPLARQVIFFNLTVHPALILLCFTFNLNTSSRNCFFYSVILKHSLLLKLKYSTTTYFLLFPFLPPALTCNKHRILSLKFMPSFYLLTCIPKCTNTACLIHMLLLVNIYFQGWLFGVG